MSSRWGKVQVKSLQDKEIAYVMRVPKGFVSEEKLGGAIDRWVSLGKSGQAVRAIVTIQRGAGSTDNESYGK